MKSFITSTLLLLALLLPATAAAYDFEVDGIYYHITGTNTVEVTYAQEYWADYSADVDIPATVTCNGTDYSVTAIGMKAFAYCNSLTSVTIPETVNIIGYFAFFECSGLTGISIPETVTIIDDGAFKGCSRLASVTIPRSVTRLGYEAFSGCSDLTSVTIPKAITHIGARAFSYCEGLTSLNVENGNETYDSRDNCNAIIETTSNAMIAACQNTVIPNSVTAIIYAFAGCSSLASVTIPNSVTWIGNEAFSGCSGLTSVSIPNSVTVIAPFAFFECSGLTSVDIPNSVIIIDDGAFKSCTRLTSVTIPKSVTRIGADAFANCTGLTSVTIPNTITTISSGMFASCYGLTSISIPNSVTSIGPLAFAYCSGLTSVTIPNSVTLVGDEAFTDCIGLTCVTIPNSVTTIGSSAFAYCSRLTSVTIPNSVTTIGERAFAYCENLMNAYCFIADLSEVSSGDRLFYVWAEEGDYDYSGRTLHVPHGAAGAYQADEMWHPYFGQIVEDLAPGGMRGDVNGDGEVNIADVNAVIEAILKGNEDTTGADVNSDSEINIGDINAVISIILSGDEEPEPDHEWVDLGLPSGTLWATCNIGASAPEEFGDYFAWGETEPKEEYTWETYKWCKGSNKTMTKYCTKNSYGAIDNKTELDVEDDAAHVNWGPSWCMPTEDQIQELMSHCSHEKTTVNGVNGLLVTGPNGNSIFLPAAGCIEGCVHQEAGLYGDYWSRTLYPDSNCFAYILMTISDGQTEYIGYRDYGFTVRAVRASR